MRRVTGIGGIFMSAKDPKSLCAWYKKHLGIDVQDWGGTAFTWTDSGGNPTKGTTVWSVGSAEGDHFAPSKSTFMVNYRVEDLAGLLKALLSRHDRETGQGGWDRLSRRECVLDRCRFGSHNHAMNLGQGSARRRIVATLDTASFSSQLPCVLSLPFPGGSDACYRVCSPDSPRPRGLRWEAHYRTRRPASCGQGKAPIRQAPSWHHCARRRCPARIRPVARGARSLHRTDC